MSEKAIAFLFALAGVGGRGYVLPSIKTIYEAVMKAVVNRIQTWGAKSNNQEGQ